MMRRISSAGYERRAWFLIAVLSLIVIGLGVYWLAQHAPKITCSMHHNASLAEWWPQQSWKYSNITLEQFKMFPFPDGLTQFDGRLWYATPYEIEVGGVLVFKTNHEPPIIAHRVIKKWQVNRTYSGYRYPNGTATRSNYTEQHIFFSTIEDNGFVQMPFERKISKKQVIGKVVPRESTPRWMSSVVKRKCRD